MRRFRLRTLRWLVLLLFLALFAAIVMRWISLERWRWDLLHTEATPMETETPIPIPEPSVPKQRVVTGRLETARLFNGITLHSAVEPTPGRAASEERVDPQSYVLDLKLLVHVPTPNRTIEELTKVSPELPKLLPGLAALLQPESVSPFFSDFYETKIRNLRANLSRLDQLLSRHNFYDCQTVLQLKHPETKRKAVLMQADMDVDSDGSDADRLPNGNGQGVSTTFQPFTSYRWKKTTGNANPYLNTWEERVKKLESEAAAKTTSAERKRELKSAIAETRDEIGSLKTFSFLVGATDPFIVIPSGFTKAEGAKVGDYAVVISGDAIYPALIGDVGPSDKTGEASLRIAKEISATATAMNRPFEDLRVSYLIFPGTAESSFGPPDLDKIYAKCESLVNELGGAGVPLHKWVSNIPTPTPTPTPSPSPTPSASPSPGVSPAPTFAFPLPSPSPTATPSATPTPSPSPTSSPLVRRKHHKSPS
ncbi:MAG: glycoside hydrolase family 75 protein [Chthoniobacterales bacterium]